MDKPERGEGGEEEVGEEGDTGLMGFPASPPHHLIQSNPVPGAAVEV